MSGRKILTGMQVLLDDHFISQLAVIIEGDKILDVVSKEQIKNYMPAEILEFSEKYYVTPGFIDCHIHGAGGHDVMDASPEALQSMRMKLAEEGVTSFLATTMTADKADIEKTLQVVAEEMQTKRGAQILGLHLEGPFISKEKMGAQMGSKTCSPDIDVFNHWQELSGDAIKLITIAPELSNAIPFISEVIHQGVRVSVGHSNATFAQTGNAIKAGVTHATHLFNAMRGLHHREPGVVGAVMLSNEVAAELIADGHHLHGAICDLALRVKGADKLLLVTDAMRAKCLGEGQYDLGGQNVFVKDGKATLKDGTLAGSVLTMPKAIKNMQKFSGCTVSQAIRMASTNPARHLGLESKGEIAKGFDADLVVLNKDLEVELTLCQGDIAYQARQAVELKL